MARHPIIQREWQRLFDLFVLRLLELRPDSMLDIGTGRGLLLTRMGHAGVDAVGLEYADKKPEQDVRIVRADAAHLPFADDSFQWVTLRHVPHHLPDLPAALKECVRVAQAGLLIAEPWFDLTDERQQISERWDRWWKRQHERAGGVHRPCQSVTDLKQALPEGGFDIEYEQYRHEVEIPPDAIAEMSQAELEALPDDDPDVAEYAEIMEAVRSTGFTYNGTQILCVHLNAKKPAD